MEDMKQLVTKPEKNMLLNNKYHIFQQVDNEMDEKVVTLFWNLNYIIEEVNKSNGRSYDELLEIFVDFAILNGAKTGKPKMNAKDANFVQMNKDGSFNNTEMTKTTV